MDKQKIVAIKTDVLRMITEEIEKKYGVKVSYRGGSYNDDNATIKIEFSEKRDGVAVTKEMGNLLAGYPNVVGKRFKHLGQEIEFVGFSTRSHKYPFIYLEIATGKRYKCARSTFEYVTKLAA